MSTHISKRFDESNVIRDSKGRFSAFLNAKSHTSIDGKPRYASPEELEKRSRELESGGYVPALAEGAYYDPRKAGNAARLAEWWDTRRMQAEYTDSDVGYAQMPDDWTPSRTAGRAMSGHRRTYRRRYEGAGVNLRMPSAASIRSFAETQKGKSFDVPVEGTFDGGTVSGWVRCTKTEDGVWITEGLDFGAKQRQVAEAVSAVLEVRKVTRALSGWESMDERRADRMRRAGARITPVKDSGFIEGFGVNPVAGVTFTKIRDKVYANAVVTDMKSLMAQDGRSKGRIYNEQIRSQPPLGPASTCEKCHGVYHPSFGSHVCLRGGAKPPSPVEDPQRQRKRQQSGILAGVMAVFGRDPRDRHAATTAPPIEDVDFSADFEEGDLPRR